ncbi:hypothetical protein BN938_2959 [Mucinivorans hirudinis]|uniref:Uncharacterized protein n=1 Tax=Mucinivorans hirudinis TaxID=1433126 RepID=A0A060REU2_9BACT|nr:hypothetical protein BN938_2959 [Mucinivorans hirudinis]
MLLIIVWSIMGCGVKPHRKATDIDSTEVVVIEKLKVMEVPDSIFVQ